MYKAASTPSRQKTTSTPTRNKAVSTPKQPVFQVTDCFKQDPTDSPRDVTVVWKGPKRCKYCDKQEVKRENMKNHSLNHFKDRLNELAEAMSEDCLRTPFPCPFFPECHDPKDSSKPKEHRDKVTFQRHFAFQHRKIYELCSYEDLMGEDIDDEDVKISATVTPGSKVKIERQTESSSLKRPHSTKEKSKKMKQIKEEVEVTVDPVALEFDDDESPSKDPKENNDIA